MQTVTLSAEDFKTIHNTLYDLRGLAQRMETSMVKVEEVERIIASFEQGLADAYTQDEIAFDDKMDYFQAYGDEHDINSIWSMFELPVGCFDLPHPYLSDSFIVYSRGHVPVLGPTWGDVYRAADCAIRNSGDDHHIFIEGFRVEGNQLHMSTGS
jgi:hypothetical protein